MASVTHQYGISIEEYEELINHHMISFDMISSISEVNESEIQDWEVRLLWKTNNQKLIVFDLDETLAHACWPSDPIEY